MSPAQRTPSWEKEKRKKKKSRLLRLIIAVVFLFLAFNLLVKAPLLIKFFNNPFEKLPKESRTLELNFSWRSNFLFLSTEGVEGINDAQIVSYEPKDKRITVLHLDLGRNLLFKKRLSTIYKSRGISGVQKYLALGLGLPIDRYVAIEDSSFSPSFVKSIKDKVSFPRVLAQIGSLDSMFGKKIKTSLTIWEYISLIFKFRSSVFEDENYLTVETKVLPNPQVDSVVEDKFLDNKILEEGAAVTIINSSGEHGLAANLTKYLNNLGASVAEIESSSEEVDNSYIFVKNEKLKVRKRLGSIVDFKEKNAENRQFPGDVLVVLGKDAVDKLTIRGD